MLRNFEHNFMSNSYHPEEQDSLEAKAENFEEEIKISAQRPEMPNSLAIEKSDQENLAAVRKSLRPESRNKGWQVIRRPEDQWKQKQKIVSDSPFDRLKSWLGSFLPTEREAKEKNEKLEREFTEDSVKYQLRSFDYHKGSGVEGMVGNKAGILAKGFAECSGLVFQAPDRAAIVHISPNAFRDPSEGGEIVRDRDVWGHVSSALKEFLNKQDEAGASRTGKGVSLTQEEVSKLQAMIDSGELRSTMFSGEDRFVPHEMAVMMGGLARFNNLPFLKVDIHYVGGIGGGGYSVYANPEDLYYVGLNGKIMKKGDNLPPVMYEYQEKKPSGGYNRTE